jgi:hypothetical protein
MSNFYSAELNEIAVVRDHDMYLLADRDEQHSRVWQCPLSSRQSSQNIHWACQVFAEEPEDIRWDPYAIEYDDSKKLVYVGDYTNSKVHVFDPEGRYYGKVEELQGDLIGPTAIAVAPGPFPAFSTFSATSTGTAGEPILASIAERDSQSEILSPSSSLSPSPAPPYNIEANGFLPGTPYATTIKGHVDSDSLVANITIGYAREPPLQLPSPP